MTLNEIIGSLVDQADERESISARDAKILRKAAKAIFDWALNSPNETPIPLETISTCELVRELKTREGVETHIAEPYQDVTVSVNGPAVVLAIID